MNQEYFNSHSSGFDQFQPPQFSDVYQTPPVASMEMLHAQTDLIEAMQDFLKKYDHIPHNCKEHHYCLQRSNFEDFKQVMEESKSTGILQELLQSLLNDLQILNEIQPLNQETFNLIQKDQEEKSIVELLAEERIQKANQALNEKAEELRESEARARIQKSIIDDDDDNLGFYAVHPNTIHTPVSQNVELRILGECNLFDIDDSYYEKSTSRLAHLAPNLPEIVEVCVNDDDTDEDDDYDDDFYDCVDIEEDGGEIDLDISKIVDISLREKLVESYLLIEKINVFSLSPPIPISPILCPSSTIPVVDLNLPLEEADVPSFRMSRCENVVLDEEEDTFTFTTRSFLPFVTYPEVLPASYSTRSEDNIFNPGKVKKDKKEAKTVKKTTRNERDKKKSEDGKPNQKLISPMQEEEVNEAQNESQRTNSDKLQNSRVHLDEMKIKGPKL
ncbi:hypothetical protein Tco_1406727 [Tanacetum coccineum]